MNGRQTILIWSTWFFQQCVEWGAVLGLFFLVPWAHYQSSVAPRLAQIETVRAQLDQEVHHLQQQDWERWAGTAMVQVQAAVRATRKRLEEHPPIYEAALARIVPERIRTAMAATRLDVDALADTSMSTEALAPMRPVVLRSEPPLKAKDESAKSPRSAPAPGILLHLPHTGPEDILWTAVNEFYGVPYLFGGEDRFGVDCSALVQAVFARLHVDLPRTAQTQFDSRLGVYVGLDDLQPGDLVFFHTRPTPYVSHVGIYLGQDEFIHAPRTGRRVEITALNAYYRSRFIAGKRLLADPFAHLQKG